MKAVKILSGMSLFIFSISAQAGFFGQSDDFKCGREDAIKAVQNTLRETASATLQTEFITSPALFSQPQGSYLNILESIPIDISNISTIGSKDSIASCTATVSIKFPEETLAVVAIAPKFFNQLVSTVLRSKASRLSRSTGYPLHYRYVWKTNTSHLIWKVLLPERCWSRGSACFMCLLCLVHLSLNCLRCCAHDTRN